MAHHRTSAADPTASAPATVPRRRAGRVRRPRWRGTAAVLMQGAAVVCLAAAALAAYLPTIGHVLAVAAR